MWLASTVQAQWVVINREFWELSRNSSVQLPNESQPCKHAFLRWRSQTCYVYSFLHYLTWKVPPDTSLLLDEYPSSFPCLSKFQESSGYWAPSLLPWLQKEQGHPVPKTKASQGQRTGGRLERRIPGCGEGNALPQAGLGAPGKTGLLLNTDGLQLPLPPLLKVLVLLHQLPLQRLSEVSPRLPFLKHPEDLLRRAASRTCEIKASLMPWRNSQPQFVKNGLRQNRVICSLEGHLRPGLLGELSSKQGLVCGHTAEETTSQVCGLLQRGQSHGGVTSLGLSVHVPLGNNSAMHYA